MPVVFLYFCRAPALIRETTSDILDQKSDIRLIYALS